MNRRLDVVVEVETALDQAEPFLVRFDPALPAVCAGDRSDDLDAAGEAPLDQGTGNRLRCFLAVDGGHDLNEVGHRSTDATCARPFSRGKRGEHTSRKESRR